MLDTWMDRQVQRIQVMLDAKATAGGKREARCPHLEPDASKWGTSGVRREALCRIPGAARKNLEERSWV